VLSETLDHVPRHTKYPFIANSVAADGSTDGSLDVLRGTITTTGRNKGIAPNTVTLGAQSVQHFARARRQQGS
jgi:hypothetical protein